MQRQNHGMVVVQNQCLPVPASSASGYPKSRQHSKVGVPISPWERKLEFNYVQDQL